MCLQFEQKSLKSVESRHPFISSRQMRCYLRLKRWDQIVVDKTEWMQGSSIPSSCKWHALQMSRTKGCERTFYSMESAFKSVKKTTRVEYSLPFSLKLTFYT